MSQAVNATHRDLRALQMISLERAVKGVFKLIEENGHEAVKRDPGVRAWVMENRAELEPMSRKGGLQ